MFGGTGGTWDVQYSLPLKAIFFLSPNKYDSVAPVDAGESVCLTVNVLEEPPGYISDPMDKDEIHALRLRRLDNVCSLVKLVPCYRLKLGEGNSFWIELEQVLH